MTLNIIHLPHGKNLPPHRQVRYDSVIKELASQSITDYKIWNGIEHDNVWTGISKAFKQIVQDAKEKKLPMVCIGEDDLQFVHADSWKYFLENIPTHFDIYLASYYSGMETADHRIDNYRGNTLIIVHGRFYDKFLNLPEEKNIDNALDGLGEYFVCPRFVALQQPGYSDNAKKIVDYSNKISQHKLFKGYEQ